MADHSEDKPHGSILKSYGFAWVTGGLFLITVIGHWLFGWLAYVNEQQAHGGAIILSGYLVEIMRDTLENWQSEFLQLIWQVGGLALLLHVGSPQSKEGDDRVEAKVDEILRSINRQDGQRIIDEIDEDYAGRHTDAGYLKRRRP